MKRRSAVLLALLSVVLPVLVMGVTPPASAIPDGETRSTVVFNPVPGTNIVTANPTAPWAYVTSPAILTRGNTLELWACQNSVGLPSGPPRISHATSTDGGQTWTWDGYALQPTSAGFDSRGTCDPSVVKAGDYWYLAYTGTDTSGHRAVFVARSATAANGSWAKWNGTTWTLTGSPAPLITDNSGLSFGDTAPSLVLSPTTLSVYYGYHATINGAPIWQTRVRTADMASINPDTWVARLVERGSVIRHPGQDTEVTCGGDELRDSTDVKYVDSLGKYVAVTSDAATYNLSTIQTWESTDGINFTQSITKRGDIRAHTMNASLIGDPSGHITTATPKAVAFNHGEASCPRNLTLDPVQLDKATTGFANQPVPSGTGGWSITSGRFSIIADKFRSSANREQWNTATYFAQQWGGSYTIDIDTDIDTGPSGVQFGQTSPTDTFSSSGYLVSLEHQGRVQIWKAGFGVVASGQYDELFPSNYEHMQIVVANGHIAVYVDSASNLSPDRMSKPVVTFVDADAPYLGGYIGLASYELASFWNFRVTDNAPGRYEDFGRDWVATSGLWETLNNDVFIFSRDPNPQPSGAAYLHQESAVLGRTFATHVGDGTYTATLEFGPNQGSGPQAWAGLNLTNDAHEEYPGWSQGGYLVFLRRNGNLGLYEAGAGQVVPDRATGTNPAYTPVTIRVLKRGSWIQVYVDDDQYPTINYHDTNGGPSIGAFGLAGEQTPARFGGVTWTSSLVG
jgi:hypothetical protein